MVALAKEIHGGLVPETTCHENVEGADPPLTFYSKPFLRGSALVEVQSVEVEMIDDEEMRYEMLIRHLARYISISTGKCRKVLLLTFSRHFARCWSNPQPLDLQVQIARRDRIRNQLSKFVEETSASILSKSTLSSLIDSLASRLPSSPHSRRLFNNQHPRRR